MHLDIERISVPFRMQPGLSRMPPGAHHLTPLDPASSLYQEKLLVSKAGQALHAVPGFDPSDALTSICLLGKSYGIEGLNPPDCKLELVLKQDLAVLDAESGTVPWMCVCVPSGWAPEAKLGLSLDAIHAPVAENMHLAAAWPHLVRLLTDGTHWQRHVWNISPSPCYDQHPLRRSLADWPQTMDPSQFARQCYLRAERQTLFPVRDAHGLPKLQAVFTIDVAMEPLASAVRTGAQARRLHGALESMSSAVLAYKNLAAAQAPLLQWLSGVQD